MGFIHTVVGICILLICIVEIITYMLYTKTTMGCATHSNRTVIFKNNRMNSLWHSLFTFNYRRRRSKIYKSMDEKFR